jgi:hypothetical protein
MRGYLLLAAALCARAAEDPREIVRRAVEYDVQYASRVRQYTFLEREDNRQLDAKGNIKERRLRTWDVTLLEGTPYRRLVGRDDKPLPEAEQKFEEDKLKHNLELRRHETPEQRRVRVEEARKKEEKTRGPVREIPDAFHFRLAGEEKIDGVDTWVIEGTPRPGFRPKAQMAFFFPKVRGKLWITKADDRWVRVEAESIDTISFGLILARVAKGATIRIDQVRVNEEVWLPRRIDVAANARLAIFKVWRGRLEYTYDKYRRFQAESRVVTGSGQ